MKIGIITYLRAVNYGSALQAYALNRYLRNNGHEVRTIDYAISKQTDLYKIFEPLKSVMSLVRNIHSFCNYYKLRKHKSRFDCFIADYIPTTIQFKDDADMESLNSQFDYFICGSDQIWNIDCADFTPAYMLDFVNDRKKCISYAPSLGAGVRNQDLPVLLQRYVSGYKAVSSREKRSISIIESAINIPVADVLDPVFLLSGNEWNKIASQPLVSGDYILGYFIGDIQGMREYAKSMRIKTGMPVIVVYKSLHDLKYRFANHYEAGPREFVSLVKNAQHVVTNSFHAVSFSIIFKKSLHVFVGAHTGDSRIIDLLDSIGLSQRIVTASSENYIDDIDWSQTNLSNLDKAIERSKTYLNNVISNSND
ncbi:polysaccharide pyruvyl transferase family protein [Parabacteroides sp.]